MSNSKDTKNIKFYFYRVHQDFSEGLFGYSFKDFFVNEFSLEKQLMEVENNKAFLQKMTNNIFSFQKFRKDFLPAIKDEVTGAVSHLELKDTEAILEQNYLYWDFNNDLIIYQSSQEGFSPSVFEKYIKWVLKNQIDSFSLKHIARKEGIEQIINSDIISSIEFTIATPNPSLLKDLGLSLEEIKDFDLDGVNTLELKITSKYKKSFLSPISLKNILNFNKNKNSFKKLKIKKRSSEFDTSKTTIDLIDKFYYVSKENVRTNEKTRNIDSSDIITILEDIYNSNIKEVLKLICK